MEKFKVSDCEIIDLGRIHTDRQGNLTVVSNSHDGEPGSLPFNVKRSYFLYDVPAGESRGSHGHKELEQIIIAASGSFSVTLTDGVESKTFFLNKPYQGLHVKPGLWRDLDDFSSGSVCLVLAADIYKKEDYIRDWAEYLKFRGL